MISFFAFLLIIFAADGYQDGKEGWGWWLASGAILMLYVLYKS